METKKLNKLLRNAGFPENYVIVENETNSEEVSIYEKIGETSMRPKMCYLSKKKMKIYLLGYWAGKNNSFNLKK